MVIKIMLIELYSRKESRFKGLSEYWNTVRSTCTGESLKHYPNCLRELTQDCGYDGELLKRQMRDRFAIDLSHRQLEIE